jgi:hypothetical protein
LIRIACAAFAATMLAIAFFAGAPRAVAQNQTPSCQGRRADVMTLTDPNIAAIDPTQIIGVHPSALASFPLPADLPDEARFDPYETTVYTTMGNLVSATLAPNQAIALVIADPDTNLSITVVFPDADHCAQSADPNVLQLMQMARQKVISTLGLPTANGSTPLTGQAIVTGIGFIDQAVAEQGNTGVELAPVLDIQFDPTAGAAGAPVATPAAAATPQPQPSATPAASASASAAAPSSTAQTSATPAAATAGP